MEFGLKMNGLDHFSSKWAPLTPGFRVRVRAIKTFCDNFVYPLKWLSSPLPIPYKHNLDYLLDPPPISISMYRCEISVAPFDFLFMTMAAP